jgi:iron(III) transport system permease protein
MLLPVIYLLIRALSGEGGVLTLWETLARPRTAALLSRTLALAVVSSVAATLIGVPLAWLTARTNLPLRRMWTVLLALPLAVPSYVGALVLIAALGPSGMIHQPLREMGLDLGNAIYGFWGASATIAVFTFPYVLLPVRAALLSMDAEREEAARVLGSGHWRTFLTVTLPQVRPAVAVGGLLVALYAVSEFGAVSLLRFDTFTRVIYTQYQSAFDRAGAAALCLPLVVLTLAIVFSEQITRGRLSEDGKHWTSGRRPMPLTPLGAWRIPSLLLCAGVLALAFATPVVVLAHWSVRGLMRGEPMHAVWQAAGSSLLVAVLAASASVLIAIPLAALIVRHPHWSTRLVERSTYLGFALPGIVIALGLVFFAVRLAPGLYQSLALLVFACVVLFFPKALGSARASLLQVHPNLEDAARCLGRRPLSALLTVTVPLMMPGLLAGAALVFLGTMKELQATLILSPIGFETLATSLWQAASEAFYARAAVPALILLAVSSVPVTLLAMRGGLAR